MRVIRQNLGWAIIYNVVAVPFAALGWITPWLAGLGMTMSSLLVVLNAVRLTKAR
jgi:Cu2+-exporting ATPase